MTADQRVDRAREFLAGARKRKVAELPPSVLARELAECRRQLGQVLDVVTEQLFTIQDAEDMEDWLDTTHIDADGGVWLTPADALVFAQALADAIAYRDRGPCSACEHAATEAERAHAYTALARALGIEVQR